MAALVDFCCIFSYIDINRCSPVIGKKSENISEEKESSNYIMEDDSSDTDTCFQRTAEVLIHRACLYFAELLTLRLRSVDSVDYRRAFLRFKRLRR